MKTIYKIILGWYARFCYAKSYYHLEELKNLDGYWTEHYSKSDAVLFHERKCDLWWDKWEKAKDKLNKLNA